MTELLRHIMELKAQREKLRRQLYEMRQSRDMWKARALSYGRGGAGQKRVRI